jgi:hypothetical protein
MTGCGIDVVWSGWAARPVRASAVPTDHVLSAVTLPETESIFTVFERLAILTEAGVGEKSDQVQRRNG